MEDDKAYIEEYCTACHKPLPPNSLFCSHCGPPQPPPRVPEGGITFSQAGTRIAVIVTVFLVIVAFKASFDWKNMFSGSAEEIVDPKDRPQDEDYKVVHYVRVAASTPGAGTDHPAR